MEKRKYKNKFNLSKKEKFNYLFFKIVEDIKINLVQTEEKDKDKKRILRRLSKIDFTVEEVPEVLQNINGDIVRQEIMLCKFFPKKHSKNAKLVVYRTPIELRCKSEVEKYECLSNTLTNTLQQVL
ncbi:MAG: hypothetical protein LBM13_03550 [Candidatus Ancillula sp.]|nr:hypothetical protein [Candidatus Ancillula sp.]